jgi:hypothetical protein
MLARKVGNDSFFIDWCKVKRTDGGTLPNGLLHAEAPPRLWLGCYL